MSKEHPYEWQRLGLPGPDALTDARLQLHWATQIVAAVPYTYLDAVPDFSHINLGWKAASGVLSSRPVGNDPRIQMGLRFADLTLVLHNEDGQMLQHRALHGSTFDEAHTWANEVVGHHMPHAPPGKTLTRPEGDLPHHPVAGGASFAATDEALAELARWYGNALLVLVEAAQDHGGPSEVRCWPHHFDMATLITLKAADDPEQMRSVGVGMTPGDEYYAEPYFYVTPWPYPKDPALPALEGEGTWHTHGWTGAVLTGSRLVAAGASSEAQASRARGFLRSAIAAARALAGG